MKLLLCKDSKYSEKCLIKVLDSSPEYVRQYSFEFFLTLANRLLNTLLCNIVYFCRGIFNYSRCNITKLIDSVSTRVGEIVSVLKNHQFVVFFDSIFFFWMSYFIVSCFVVNLSLLSNSKKLRILLF